MHSEILIAVMLNKAYTSSVSLMFNELVRLREYNDLS